MTTEEMRAELERLQARRARSRDPKTRARLDERIRVLTLRIGRG
jgi:hypothetical protein